ncbi:hypothetical protein M9Y10_001497 [Tritrichomonas musculus]|uniref:Calcineurin-like phosphoesterase domain-containing protein n=1 Tax=Tritrichomonas musculus TaxID=1915356 RepID=A0ABR2LA91_9EUKA
MNDLFSIFQIPQTPDNDDISQSDSFQIRFSEIKIDNFDIFKGLIVADFHLHKTSQLQSYDEDLLIFNLRHLVKETNPTHMFILGDIIHFFFNRKDECYFSFFQKLENNFSIPIYIIPGNHDYDGFSLGKNCFGSYNNQKNVKCFDVEFLEIKFSENFSVFLGHDAHNNSFVHGNSKIISWMNKIRHFNSCKDRIKDTDVVIVGHTHEDVDDDETKNYSIAPFSVSYNLDKGSYGIISFNDGFKFEHKTDFNLILNQEANI